MHLLLALMLAGPASGATAAQAAVLRLEKERCAALAARDTDRFFSFLSDDAAFFPDGMPVAKGRAAVRALLVPFFDPKGPTVRCEPAAATVSRAADFAYVTGTYDETGTPAARGPNQGHGKYVSIWRKSGRTWKLALHIGNDEPPARPDFGPPPQP
jgi:uncharacterized protein (TIGR02246 family)